MWGKPMMGMGRFHSAGKKMGWHGVMGHKQGSALWILCLKQHIAVVSNVLGSVFNDDLQPLPPITCGPFEYTPMVIKGGAKHSTYKVTSNRIPMGRVSKWTIFMVFWGLGLQIVPPPVCDQQSARSDRGSPKPCGPTAPNPSKPCGAPAPNPLKTQSEELKIKWNICGPAGGWSLD